METTHRKIELQSPLDLSYLQSNAHAAAHEKLDLHFPPSAAPESGDDAMKKRVEELVSAYITTTFASASQNLSVNGLEGKEIEEAVKLANTGGEELEIYDSKLAFKLQKVGAQIEALTLQVAGLRRAAPEQAARAYLDKVKVEDEVFGKAREDEENKRIEGVRKDVLEEGVGQHGVRDWEEASRNWERAMATLGEVKDKVGGTAARLEQAREAASYLERTGK